MQEQQWPMNRPMYTEEVVGDYQCGLRRECTTTDQLFALKLVMEGV